jgi:hypothetical protein
MRDGYNFDDTLSYGGLFDMSEHADARGRQALQVRESFSNHFVGNGDLEWQYGKISMNLQNLKFEIHSQHYYYCLCLFQQIDISLGSGTYIVFKNKIKTINCPHLHFLYVPLTNCRNHKSSNEVQWYLGMCPLWNKSNLVYVLFGLEKFCLVYALCLEYDLCARTCMSQN